MTATVDKITYTATAEQIERMHQAFDEALAAAPREFGKTYPMIVNGVAPGPILWPDKDGLFDEVARQRTVSHTLMKRTGEPEDIARAVHYLIADAPYVTGQIIAVDGGRSINL